MGGAGRAFPATTQGLVARLRSGGLEELSRRYWKPVYAYLRAAHGKTNEDAKDLTQAFFLRLFESGELARFDPARGSLRAYLKTLLRSFVGHQDEALRALKRGGGARLLPLDDALPAVEGPPEDAFDRHWRLELARQVLDGYRADCEAAGRGARFRIYEAYALVPPDERPTYAALAAALGMSENDVRNHLFAARAELRERTRAALAELSGGDLEWNELLERRTKA